MKPRANKLRLTSAVAGTLLFLCAWHIASTYLLPQSSALPSPLKVARALESLWLSGDMAGGVTASVRRIAFGFAVALLIAVCFSAVAARLSYLYSGMRPVLELLSSIPPIAWTPLAIMWFGIGELPALFIVTLGAFFPMFTSFYAGITRVDSDLVNVAKTLGASPTRIVSGVVFPAALPTFTTGMRTGLAVAWFNVIAAELIGVRSGLGYQLQLNRTLLLSDRVVALMLVIGVLGLLMSRSVNFIGNLASPWAVQDETRARWLGRRRLISRWMRRLIAVFARQSDELSPPDPAQINKSPGYSEPLAVPLLTVEHLSKSYGGEAYDGKVEVLRDVSLSVSRGEVVAVIGPNGSGKTTLLNIIAGLLRPDAGGVRFRGEEVRSPARERAIVFQSYALFPFLTCRGNINFAVRTGRAADREAAGDGVLPDRMVSALLEEVRLSDFADAYPVELSGGMRQRLAIARALAASPDLILLDEPFASYDPMIKEESQQAILNLIASRSLGLLIVTHDLDEAILMADRVIVLSERPASVKATVEVTLPRPRSAEVRRCREFDELRSRLLCLLKPPEGMPREFVTQP